MSVVLCLAEDEGWRQRWVIRRWWCPTYDASRRSVGKVNQDNTTTGSCGIAFERG